MTEQTQYLVTWEVDVWAKTPKDAAKQARRDQTRKGTTATVFTVANESGVSEIDLLHDTENRREAS